ncbi:MAG: T9SS type A sorting domain-containing protein [Hymenobacter sp.]|nr:MAG: T9SS type A sorting domain-containing protein [Hymenobacter sp.]
MKHIFYFCLLALLLGNKQAIAQTFADPTPNHILDDNFTIYVAGTGYDAQNPFPQSVLNSSTKAYFTAKLFRAARTQTTGYVDVFVGTSATSLSSPALTAASHTVIQSPQWLPVYDVATGQPGPYEFATISSADFTISPAQLTGATGFYAVYTDNANGSTKQGAVSRPVAIAATPPPTPTPSTPSPTRPLTDFIPCGRDTPICGDQCVTKGTAAAPIKGRILADQGYPPLNTFCYLCNHDPENPEWSAYGSSAYAAKTTRFAEGTEFEWVQWQSRTDYSDWADISGATSASYSPGIINQTTYYRRVSSHIRYRFPTNYREEWYKSNIVTIRIPSAAPVAVQNYIACGSSSIDVAVRQAADATSYNWFCADPTVKINGQSTSYYNQYTSTTTVVKITLTGASQGASYPIYVSSVGLCGARSSISTVNVTVDCTVPAPPNVSFIPSPSGSTCQPRYDVRIGRVIGATSYQATLHGTSLYEGYTMTIAANPNAYYVDIPFNIAGPSVGIYASVTATTSQGTSAPFSNSPQSLAGGNCGYIMAAPADLDAALYPNPATDQVTVAGESQETQAAFYDSRGVCRKVVSLPGQNVQGVVDLHELPNGLYHVRISAKGKLLKSSQLSIKH